MAKGFITGNKPVQVKFPDIRSNTLAEARVNAGVITMIDPADIPNGALSRGKNIAIRFDKTLRRFGTTIMTPAKPNSNKVLGLFFFKLKNGSGFTFRVTRDSIHFLTGASWTALTGTALVGTDVDRFQFVNVLDEVIFSNNGANVLQKMDLGGGTYADLGNAPAYRYVTGFYNRAIGAALAGVNENEVGWSADGDEDEWNNAVNETAGSSPILESPSDLSDHIKGIFAFTNFMILLREQSIWLATKKPIPTDPFNFVTAFPGVGSDCPNSVAVIPNGIAWLDTRTGTIWAYTPGSSPEPIGRKVEKDVLAGLDNPETCFGSYNGLQAEYTIAIPRAASSIVTTWTYNFRTQAWAEGEYENISSIDDIDLVSGSLINSLRIDDLVGTIDGLIGTIDQLISSDTAVNVIGTRVFGKTDGDILIEDENSELDGVTAFETIIESKVFKINENDTQILELVIEYLKKLDGAIEIYWSDDAGETYVLYGTIATNDPLGKRRINKTFGPLRARDYKFKLRAVEGQFDILSYEIKQSVAGESRAP